MTRPLNILAVFTLLGSLLLVAFGRPVQAATVVDVVPRPQSVPAPPLDRPSVSPTADISCATSPFGRVLTLGGDKEIFVGYRGGSATTTASWLQYTQLDLSGDVGLEVKQNWLGGTDDAGLRNVRWPAAVAADLNGDGKVEYVQALIDATGAYRAVAHRNGQAADFWRNIASNNQELAIAAGNLTRNTVGHERVAIASRSAIGSLDVIMLTGDAAGGIGSDDGAPLGLWRTNQNGRANARQLRITTADLDGDGYDDEIVVLFREDSSDFMQVIVLEYDSTLLTGSGSNIQQRMREIGSLRFEAGGDVLSMAVAAGDVDGDFQDEIVVAWDNERPDNDGISDKTTVRTLRFTPGVAPATTGMIAEKGIWEDTFNTQGLGLAVADTDRDGLAEIAVAHTVFSDTARLALRTMDAEQSKILVHNSWQSNDEQRGTVDELVLEAGDLDRDGMAELVAAFRDDGNLLQVLRLADQEMPAMGLMLKGFWRNGEGGRTGARDIMIDLADWENDSVKAHYEAASGSQLLCKRVTEPQITAAVFRPPFWQAIQSGYIYGSIGESESVEQTNSTAYTSFHSHSVSAYFGGGVDAEAFSAIAKVTAGYEFSASQTRSGETSNGETTSEGWLNAAGDFVVVDKTIYDCYSYQVKTGATPLDSVMRFCEYQDLSQEAPTLDTWDTQDSPVNNPAARQWAPISRDWASLALLRGAQTAQSTTAAGRSSARAVDGNTNGLLVENSVAQTASGTAPWWQVDLGTSQELTKIRVWNSSGIGCGAQPCGARLHDFKVFVSDTDFRTISNDPAVLENDPRVQTFTHSGPTSSVANVVTINNDLDPANGRYVRVQLAGAGVLALAEVQVFGTNQVEPDRYPVAVSDPDAKRVGGVYIPGTDGWFQATVYLPATGVYTQVRTRGNLLWNGADHGVLANKTVGPGDGIPEWSLTKDYGEAETTADSLTNSASIGAEFDIAAGVLGKVVAGGGYEYSTGLTTEHSQTTSWTRSFEIGGGVQGFPTRVDGQTVLWPDQCKYQFQPYYYEIEEQSDTGYRHRMLTVDYIVPMFLDRTKNMTPCRNGTFQTSVNSSTIFLPLATR